MTDVTRGVGASIPPFDLADPPEEPPDACADLRMWAVARELLAEHEPFEGSCESCGTTDVPCEGSTLAIQGLQVACGVPMATGAFWVHLMQVKGEQDSR
ncbi:hypothetical protein F4553_002043 [Allocatelliglobosispora scoriae]|uniref:Uncharacterized protein n=1 Tax=Allocatelliglobosispora scoriae TaxID=643052 RepID=A0A841BK66_9ACTN|nr:hypothetical protein [Allocatelliglobosispora scoriae]MBB5868664.1 hypothetical protein [Allocatelliglobosispora scoriae]